MFGGSLMDEEKVERLLREAKDLIPVDQQLKTNLRKSFETKRKRKPPFILGIAVAAALLFLSVLVPTLQSKPANADELLVTQAKSFIEVVQGKIDTLSQQDGKIYVTMKDGKTFILTSNGLKEAKKPSIKIKSTKFTFYEEQGTIYKENGKTHKKEMVDQGHSPSMSASGDYITYIKEVNGLDQIWVADSNLKTKQQLTTNLLQKETDTPLFQYRTPVWGEGNTIYFVKERMINTEIVESSIMKMELGTETLTSRETVAHFMQALIMRDDDYAKSLMESPPEILTVSIPSVTGYKIISVDANRVLAEITFSDSHLPYSSTNFYEFKLNKEDGRYKIEDISEMKALVISSNDLKILQLMQDGVTKDLLSIEQLNNEHIKSADYRLSSTSYDLEKKIIYFGVQEMEVEDYSISLWAYDIQRNKIEFLQRVNQSKVIVERIVQSPNGKYLAANLFSEVSGQSFVYVVDLVQQSSYQIDNASIQYWDGETLMVDAAQDEYRLLKPIEIQHLKPNE